MKNKILLYKKHKNYQQKGYILLIAFVIISYQFSLFSSKFITSNLDTLIS